MNLTDVLATHRLVRLLAADVILDPVREATIRAMYAAWRPDEPLEPPPDPNWASYAELDPDAPKLARLLTCRWCLSVWVAAGVVAARRYCPRAWGPVASALALSSGSTLLARWED